MQFKGLRLSEAEGFWAGSCSGILSVVAIFASTSGVVSGLHTRFAPECAFCSLCAAAGARVRCYNAAHGRQRRMAVNPARAVEQARWVFEVKKEIPVDRIFRLRAPPTLTR